MHMQRRPLCTSRLESIFNYDLFLTWKSYAKQIFIGLEIWIQFSSFRNPRRRGRFLPILDFLIGQIDFDLLLDSVVRP